MAECESSYRVMLNRNGLIDDSAAEPIISDQTTASGAIEEIRSAVVDGNTMYYLRLQGETVYYVISAADDESAVILNVGDEVTIRHATGEGSILNAYSIERGTSGTEA